MAVLTAVFGRVGASVVEAERGHRLFPRPSDIAALPPAVFADIARDAGPGFRHLTPKALQNRIVDLTAAAKPLQVAVEQLVASPLWAESAVAMAAVGYDNVDSPVLKMLVHVDAAKTTESGARELAAKLASWPRLNSSLVAVKRVWFEEAISPQSGECGSASFAVPPRARTTSEARTRRPMQVRASRACWRRHRARPAILGSCAP